MSCGMIALRTGSLSWLRRLVPTVAEACGAGSRLLSHKYTLDTSPTPCYPCIRESATESRIPIQFAATTAFSPDAQGQLRRIDCGPSAWRLRQTEAIRSQRTGQNRSVPGTSDGEAIPGSIGAFGPFRGANTPKPELIQRVRATPKIGRHGEKATDGSDDDSRNQDHRLVLVRLGSGFTNDDSRGNNMNSNASEETKRSSKQEEQLEDREIVVALRKELERGPKC